MFFFDISSQHIDKYKRTDLHMKFSVLLQRMMTVSERGTRERRHDHIPLTPLGRCLRSGLFGRAGCALHFMPCGKKSQQLLFDAPNLRRNQIALRSECLVSERLRASSAQIMATIGGHVHNHVSASSQAKESVQQECHASMSCMIAQQNPSVQFNRGT